MLRILQAIIGVDDDRGRRFKSGGITNETTGSDGKQIFKGSNNNTGHMTGNGNGQFTRGRKKASTGSNGSISDSDSG
ncbi:hypothetical protein O6P43_021844 [Quillaja saponaria]|uniref:Uncharacterized protein n=1 Tax=Quillaja saponaria TaxID=32244 RepID=A0AAD7PHQ5_QUISA|nr:hypothetical protein O6P43_021844 [Quillaja saponaria]